MVVRLLACAPVVLVSVASAVPGVARANERLLLALYYPWFGPRNFGPGLTAAFAARLKQ